MQKIYITNSAEETILLGQEFGKSLPIGSIICFFGDLAGGKTTFIKGLVNGALNYPLELINSPTFTYLNIYEGNKTIYHFDLYRLKNKDEFLLMGFDEFLNEANICCIEWSERIEDILPSSTVKINFEHLAENIRKITITN